MKVLLWIIGIGAGLTGVLWTGKGGSPLQGLEALMLCLIGVVCIAGAIVAGAVNSLETAVARAARGIKPPTQPTRRLVKR